MTGIDKTGQQVSVDRVEVRPHVLFDMADRTDQEIRGLFAKTLKVAGIEPARASKILRLSERTYFRDLATRPIRITPED